MFRCKTLKAGFLPTLQQLGYDDSEVAEAMQDDPRGLVLIQISIYIRRYAYVITS